MSIQDLNDQARKAMYRPKKFVTLQRWNSNARQLKDEMNYFNELVDDYLGLNRPLVLN